MKLIRTLVYENLCLCSHHTRCVFFQTAILLLRIDDIVSGTKKQMDALNAPAGGGAAPAPEASEGPEP